ncbi:MAG: peptidoglycan DD-metalloendopeptidase family protein [Bacteroidota bacterium]
MQLMFKTRNIKSLVVFFCFFGIIVFMCVYPFAQNQQAKDKLLDKKKQIEEEIAYYKKLIDETKKTRNLSVNQLVLLKNQIAQRENLIDEINSEMLMLDNIINQNMQKVQRSKAQLQAIKDGYAKMIYNAYKNRNAIDRLMFIFASKDFNQAYQRLKYLQQYNEYLHRQVDLILNTTNEILEKNKELVAQKNDKHDLLLSSEEEKEQLALEKEKKDADVKKLKQTEKDLRNKLKQKEEQARVLRNKIESVITDEIKKSAHKSNITITNTTTVKNVLTPEEKVVSDNFSINKGKLPWPVERGVITGSFGEHPHPVLEGIKVKNNGVDISTTPGAAVRVVLNGVVSSIVSITNNNKAVIVRHGEFFTVYSNLQSVSVKKDQQVATKQNIGIVSTGADDGKTELHFEVWQGKLTCNPAEWLARK